MKKFLLSAVACLAVAGAASATDLYIRGGNFGWDSCTEANKFTDNGDGTYTISLETLSTGFKIAAGPTWNDAANWGSATNIELDKEYTLTCSGGSGNITIKGGASFTNVTVNFNSNTGVMKCTGTTTSADWATIDMYLVGDEFGWADSNSKMTWSNGVYTITVPSVSADVNFKFSNPPAWQYHYGDNCTFEGNAADAIVGADNDFAIKATRNLTNVTFKLNPNDNVLTVDEGGAGVETIEAEAAAADAVYYNLQGVRVANPAEGMYIRVQAGKASKVIL